MSQPPNDLEKASYKKMTDAMDALALSNPSTPTANSMLSPNSNSIKELQRALPESGHHGNESNHSFMKWPAGWTEEMKQSHTRRIIEATFDPIKEENRRFLDDLAKQAGKRFGGMGEVEGEDGEDVEMG